MPLDPITVQFDSQLRATERLLIERAADFGRQMVAPHALRWEQEGRYPLETLRAACAEGLASVQLAPELGGKGMSFSTKLRVVEELARHDFGFAFSLVNHHNAMVRIAQAARGIVDRLLREMLSGNSIGCSAYTEPECGSDLGRLKTSASRAAGGWRLNGQKAWITNAAVAQRIVVMARTEDNGVGLWIIETERPGFVREPAYAVQGAHAIALGGFRLDDYLAPDEALLEPPGTGFKSALNWINGARAYVAAMCAGMLESAIQCAVRYAHQRQAFEHKLIEFQGLRWSLVDAMTDLAAMRLLAYRAARQIDAGEPAEEAAALAKKFAPHRALTHLAACVQSMGARGLLSEYPLMRHLAACKMAAFADGTTEVMNERLGRILSRRYGPDASGPP